MSGDLQVRERPRAPVVAPPPIDPRIAARWIAVRRDHHVRRRRRGLSALTVVTVVVGLWILARSPLLAVHDVVVRGRGHTNRIAVLTAARLSRSSPMLDVDLAAVGRRVEALPWVARAHVGRHWPSTVTITITERTPVAQVSGNAGQLAIVDAAGRVLTVGPARSAGGQPTGQPTGISGNGERPLPALQGIAVVGAPGSVLAPEARVELTLLLALRSSALTSTSSGTAFTVSSVARSDNGSLSARLAPGGSEVIFGSTDRLAAKLVALRLLLSQIVPGVGATIDVRVAEAPVLTAGAKSSSLSTTQRG